MTQYQRWEVETTISSAAQRWALVAPHRQRLVKIAAHLLHDGCEAEDVADDALLKAVTWNRELDATKLPALLNRIVGQLVIDRHRKNVLRRQYETSNETSHIASAEDLAVGNLQTASLMGKVVALPTQRRRVFSARLAGYEPGQTAEILGMSRKAVELAYGRARKDLRKVADGMGSLLLALRGFRPEHALVGLMPFLAIAVIVPSLEIAPTKPDTDANTYMLTLENGRDDSIHASARPPRSHTSPPANTTGVSHSLARVWVGAPNSQTGYPVYASNQPSKQTRLQEITTCLSAGLSLNLQKLGCQPSG